MAINYTMIDVIGTAKATAIMPLFAFVPGYVLGWVLDVLGFRRRRPMLKILLSVPLAIACCPAITYLLARTSHYLIWVFYGAAWATFAFLVAASFKRRRARSSTRSVYVWLSVVAAAVWVVIAIGSLVDLQLGNRLYYSVPSYDYAVRTAFTAAALRNIPPGNPFFATNPPTLLRYHYFWLLFCSLASKVAFLDPRHAMFGATVWCGIGLLCLIALWVKFYVRPARNLERKCLIGACLLAVTGLDIIPTIILRLHVPHVVRFDMEWWNVSQITSWADSLLWVPHHLAGLVACLSGFLVLYAEQRRFVAIIVAALAFASAVGLSIYVTFTFALFAVLWTVYTLIYDRRKLWTIVSVGLLTLCFAWPYLHTLAGPGHGGGFLVFRVRSFSLATEILQRYNLEGFWPEELVNAALLPLNYFLELGFFLLIAVDRGRKVWKGSIPLDRDEVTAWLAVATSFLVGTFLRSNTITNNDLGFRCFLLAQFFLLLWAVPVVDGWLFAARASFASRPAKRFLPAGLAVACLALGVVGSTYQLLELRLYSVAADRWSTFRRSWMDGDGQLGKRTYALRRAYDELEHNLTPGSVIQFNPLTGTYLPHLLYTTHPTAALGKDCGTEFGGSPDACVPRIQELSHLFGDGVPSQTEGLDDLCRRNGIDVLLAKDTDPVWRDHSSWVWRQHPIVANQYVRAFHCRESDAARSVRTSQLQK